MIVNKGATDVSVYVAIGEDAGGANRGDPKTGVLFSDLTSGSFLRQGAVRVGITPITLASASAAHSDGGFIEVDATNMPGIYRFDVPDAAFATGVGSLIVTVQPKVAQNALSPPLRVDLQNDISVDDVWDEVLTGGTHNVTNSSGKKLRQLTSRIVRQNTAQGPGTGNNQIQLDTGASAIDGDFDPGLILIESGTGAGQSRGIIEYNGTTKIATVDRDWRLNPDATSDFIIIADAGRQSVNEGLAQAGTSNTITLNALAASGDGTYIDQIVFLRSGTGQDQVGVITAYNGTTKVATISKNWIVTPDSTTGYVMLPAADVALTSTGEAAIADAVWDEVLTGGTHNVANSSGRRLRQVPGTVVRQDTAQGPGTNNNQIQLDAAASSVDGTFDPSLIFIEAGTGIGQSRNILEYDGATKTATVDRNWKVLPDATSQFVIVADAGREHVNEGLAQAGTSTTITLNALASSTTDAYCGQIVFIRSGTGDDQVGTVISYNGTTKVATLDRAWGTIPDSTSGYVMLPSSPVELTTDTISTMFTTAFTESYAADGAAPTLTQALMLIQQTLTEFAITGTSLRINKVDGSTQAAIITLNDAADPTAATRTS